MQEGFTWGGGPDLSPWETVMWRIYEDPHTRSMGTFVEILDQEPDWERLVQAHVRGSYAVPRLRERIVEPALLVGTPSWSVDPNWDIAHHLYRVRLPEPGTMAQFHTTLADLHERPLDRGRAPWEAILITGLEGGRAAYLFKSHHAFADGMGIIQLLELVHSHTREPGARHTPKPPPRRTVTPYTLAAKRLTGMVTPSPDLVRRLPKANPVSAAGKALDYVRSLKRQASPPELPRSPLLQGKGGIGIRVLTFDVPLDRLRAGAKAGGGTINDGYLAAMIGGLRRYHEHFGVSVAEIPMTIPVSTRRVGDAPGGNHFSAARLIAPIGQADPAKRIKDLRAQVKSARAEPAIGWLDPASKVLDKLPTAALVELMKTGTASTDLQLSNFPGVSWEAYVAGAKVTGIYGIGPRPGVAMMGIMLSYEGKGCIGLHLDPDAFTDLEVLQRCLLEGFDEVFALADIPSGSASR